MKIFLCDHNGIRIKVKDIWMGHDRCANGILVDEKRNLMYCGGRAKDLKVWSLNSFRLKATIKTDDLEDTGPHFGLCEKE